jgi:hypothetical protein
MAADAMRVKYIKFDSRMHYKFIIFLNWCIFFQTLCLSRRSYQVKTLYAYLLQRFLNFFYVISMVFHLIANCKIKINFALRFNLHNIFTTNFILIHLYCFRHSTTGRRNTRCVKLQAD